MKKILLLSLIIAACGQNSITDPELIIDRSITRHGLDQLTDKTVQFDFRDKTYSFLREADRYTYTRSFQDSLGYVEDHLVNSSDFTRTVDGVKLELDKEWSDKYLNSVNSVHYFVQLPFTLKDPAAIKTYQGVTQVKEKAYHQVEVRFQSENGGKDFEDVFLYWFNTEDYSMDYLAYSYLTEGGGVRFREAINRSKVGGIVFQDYINYKPAEKGTPLTELKSLFEAGKLIELSRIENVNISVN